MLISFTFKQPSGGVRFQVPCLLRRLAVRFRGATRSVLNGPRCHWFSVSPSVYLGVKVRGTEIQIRFVVWPTETEDYPHPG